MGCLCSREADERQRNQTADHYVRRVVPETKRPSLQESYLTPKIHAVDERQRNQTADHYVRRVVPETKRPLQESYLTPKVHASHHAAPLYGEYKCSSCGRTWRSLLSWRDGFQICKRCKVRVYPTNQRELRPSDWTRDQDDVGEHPKEFCQKCQQLGRFCGRYNRNAQRT